jgi:hypothetical protein
MSSPPKLYLEAIDPLIVRARQMIEAGEELAPFAFVGRFAERQIVPVLLDTHSSSAKDASVAAVRRIATELQADFVFTLTESWGLGPEHLRDYRRILARYGSIAASPYRIELATFMLETRYGLWGAQARIKSPSKRAKTRRSVGPIEWRPFDGAEGRFVGLLPDSDEPAALH